MSDPTSPSSARREFLKTSTVLAGTLAAAPLVHSAGSDAKGWPDRLRRRGTGAAENALKADKNVKLYAMADAFEDRLLYSLKTAWQGKCGRRRRSM